MVEMTAPESASRGIWTTLLGQWAKFVLQVLSVATLARLLTPEDFGLIAMVTALIGVAAVLGDFGLSMAAIQSSTLTDSQRTNLFWLNSGFGALLSLLIAAASWPIAAFYDRPELVPVTQALALTFLFSSVGAQFRAEANRKLRFTAMAVVDVISLAGGLAVGLTVAVSGGGYWALVVQQIVSALLASLLIIAPARWRPGMPSRGVPMRSLVTFGANTTGVQLINYASANLDSVLVGKYHGGASLGFYDRAFQLFRMPLQQLATPLTRVALPVLSRINDAHRYNATIQQAHLALAYVVGGVFVGAAAVVDPLVQLFLGPGWDQTKAIFTVLALGGLFQAMAYSYYWIFVSKAMTSLQLRLTVIARTNMLLLMCAAIPLGPLGIAGASSVGLAISWAIMTRWGIPKTGVDTGALVRISLRAMALYGVMFSITWPLSTFVLTTMHPLLELVMLVLLGLLIVCAGAVLPVYRSDMTRGLEFVQRSRGR